MKTYLRTVFAMASVAIFCAFWAVPAHAQATRTWVSGVGDDVNPCSRTAPCKTFAGAISKTAVFGEINCLDSGGFGAVTITKSITIKCEGVIGGILAANVTGVLINDTTSNPKIVTLSGLDIEGDNTGINGIRFLAGGTLHVHKTQIRGFRASGTGGNGIFVDGANNFELFVADGYITDNGSNSSTGGIVIRPAAGGSANAHINNVQVENNSSGVIADGTLSTTGVNVNVRNSNLSGSANNGITAVSSAAHAPVSVMVNHSSMNANVGSGINANGVAATGAGSAVVRVGNSVIANNVTAVSQTGSGQVRTYSDNQVNANSGGEAFTFNDPPK